MTRYLRYIGVFVLAGVCGAALLAWSAGLNRGGSVVDRKSVV